MMSDAVALEFDFPPLALDNRRSRIARVVHLFKCFSAVMDKEGVLIPLMLGAKALDVSRTRMDELVSEGRLKRIEVDGHVFLTENSMVEYAKEERKNGRPLKLIDSQRAWRDSVVGARDMVSAAREKK